jgi:hypothetical protein
LRLSQSYIFQVTLKYPEIPEVADESFLLKLIIDTQSYPLYLYLAAPRWEELGLALLRHHDLI